MKKEPNKELNLKHRAYSVVQLKSGKFAVVEINFNADDGLVENSVKVIESNTDKFVIKERLQIILMTEDMV